MSTVTLDEKDRDVLGLLMEDEDVGEGHQHKDRVAVTTVYSRIKRLEDTGVIRL
jgi:DNA-binding Lrp family transcriptional regulator